MRHGTGAVTVPKVLDCKWTTLALHLRFLFSNKIPVQNVQAATLCLTHKALMAAPVECDDGQ